MISIRESINELERIDKLPSAAFECYLSALQALAQYAVEFDEDAASAYRRRVAGLCGDLHGRVDADQLFASLSVLRDELSDYHDRARDFLRKFAKKCRRRRTLWI